MRILVAPDKFKGSMTAREATQAISEGVLRVCPDAGLDLVPLADGGDGTVDALSEIPGTEVREAACRDALGRASRGRYIWFERDPRRSSTAGTGDLILAALELGPDTIAVGLGGSATNDAGAGMVAALGWKFLGPRRRPLEPIPENFRRMKNISWPLVRPGARFIGLSDVRTPLLGPRGCSRVFARQKGASENDVGVLEDDLLYFADLCAREAGDDFRDVPGAGAAGGLGFGLMTFLGASIVSGFEWIAGRLGLDERIARSDLVITGEGSLDAQTLEGKGPGALAALAKKHGKRCVAFAGRIDPSARSLFDACHAITGPAMELAEALPRGAQLLREAAAEAARAFPL